MALRLTTPSVPMTQGRWAWKGYHVSACDTEIDGRRGFRNNREESWNDTVGADAAIGNRLRESHQLAASVAPKLDTPSVRSSFTKGVSDCVMYPRPRVSHLGLKNGHNP